MQLKRFEVTNLFGEFNHTITFPTRGEDSLDPSVVILCGPNGIGKTRTLGMIQGFISLKFGPFRDIPFEHAELQFSDSSKISVHRSTRKVAKKDVDCLSVKFKNKSVDLKVDSSGALLEEEVPTIEAFREYYFEFVSSISMQLVTTARLQNLYEERDKLRKAEAEQLVLDLNDEDELVYARHMSPRRRSALLSDQVKRFIRDAQLNTRRFFSAKEPDLFSRILKSLTEKSERSPVASKELIHRLEVLREKETVASTYGLIGDSWNFKELQQILKGKGNTHPPLDPHATTVVQTYLEFLESRASERHLLVTRLKLFEETINSFFVGKSITVSGREGIQIISKGGLNIKEHALSSGEYHLLFLCVTALTTQRRGAVIAIDEPEISMHLSWQRRLIPALIACASSAQPQVIIATHSPDITASYPDNCVHLESNR